MFSVVTITIRKEVVRKRNLKCPALMGAKLDLLVKPRLQRPKIRLNGTSESNCATFIAIAPFNSNRAHYEKGCTQRCSYNATEHTMQFQPIAQ